MRLRQTWLEVDEIRELFESAIETFGDVDIAVANAGLEIVDVATVDFTEEQSDRASRSIQKGRSSPSSKLAHGR